jgi:prepilin-type N-terminal cleavage/methylation domain-containing protein
MRGRVRVHDEGMTMIEMVVVLGIIAVLAAILTPVVANYIDQSRLARAQSDVRVIGEAISRFESDMSRYPMFTNGSGNLPDSAADVIRLEGPGTSLTDTSGNTTNWVNGSVSDLLADQLLSNAPAYSQTSSLAKPFKWKGPYINPDADPWGRKYVVNIANAKSTSAYACFVLSAGPDGIVQTPFSIAETSSVTASGDDIIFRIK